MRALAVKPCAFGAPLRASGLLMTGVKRLDERFCIRAKDADGGVFLRMGSGGQGVGAITTVEQFLIRGLATACQAFVVGLPRSDRRRSALPLPSPVEDSPDRHGRPGHRLRSFVRPLRSPFFHPGLHIDAAAVRRGGQGRPSWWVAFYSPFPGRTLTASSTAEG